MPQLLGITLVLALILAGLPAVVAAQGASTIDKTIAYYSLTIAGGTPRPPGPFGNAPVAIGATTSPTPARAPRSGPATPAGPSQDEGGGCNPDVDLTGFLPVTDEGGGNDAP